MTHKQLKILYGFLFFLILSIIANTAYQVAKDFNWIPVFPSTTKINTISPKFDSTKTIPGFNLYNLDPNWQNLSKAQKSVLIRDYLSKNPQAWTTSSGSIPPSHYLNIGMNPLDRNIIEDYLLVTYEKLWRIQLSGLLTRIIFMEDALNILENEPTLYRNQTRRKLIRQGNNNVTVATISQRIEIEKETYLREIHYNKSLLKDIIVEYNNFGTLHPTQFDSFENVMFEYQQRSLYIFPQTNR